jgi:phosphatidylglycerophosphate synthase
VAKGLTATYREILGTYYGQLKERTERRFLFYRYIYRPLSFPLTALAVRLGASADGVTLIGLALLVASLAALALADRIGMLPGALLFFAYYVLDFVDGNIARYRGGSSYFGKLIDGMVDSVSFLVFAAAAWGNARAGTSLIGAELELALGVAATLSALLRQNYRFRLAYFKAEMELASGQAGKMKPAPAERVPPVVWLFDNLSTSTPLILLLAAATNQITLFVLAFFALWGIAGNVETALSILKNRAALGERREH